MKFFYDRNHKSFYRPFYTPFYKSFFKRKVPIFYTALLTASFSILSGCGSAHQSLQAISTSAQQEDLKTSQTTSSGSVHVNVAHTSTHAQMATTGKLPVMYGPPLPSPAQLAAIHGTYELQPAPEDIPILMYHSISYRPKNTLCVSPDRFAAEMKHLYDAGYHTIGFGDLKNAWLAHQPLPKKPILITFDDGYEDNYTAAYPVLKRYSMRATIFVITHAVNNSPSTLTWDQIRFMDQQGLIQFGDHTVDHLDLSHLSPAQQQYEIAQSKATLEQQLGHPILAFCFPSGRYNTTTLQLLKQAGFVFATTTKPGYANLKQGQWTLDRVRVSGDETPAIFDSVFQ